MEGGGGNNLFAIRKPLTVSFRLLYPGDEAGNIYQSMTWQRCICVCVSAAACVCVRVR